MAKEISLFKSEEKKDLSEVADFLRDLADRLDKRRVILKKGEKKLKLDLPDRVELEIEVEKEIGKRKTEMELEIEISWVVGKSGKPKDKGKLSLG